MNNPYGGYPGVPGQAPGGAPGYPTHPAPTPTQFQPQQPQAQYGQPGPGQSGQYQQPQYQQPGPYQQQYQQPAQYQQPQQQPQQPHQFGQQAQVGWQQPHPATHTPPVQGPQPSPYPGQQPAQYPGQQPSAYPAQQQTPQPQSQLPAQYGAPQPGIGSQYVPPLPPRPPLQQTTSFPPPPSRPTGPYGSGPGSYAPPIPLQKPASGVKSRLGATVAGFQSKLGNYMTKMQTPSSSAYPGAPGAQGQYGQNLQGPGVQGLPGAAAPYGQPHAQSIQPGPPAPYGQQHQGLQGQPASPAPYGQQAPSLQGQAASPAPYGQQPAAQDAATTVSTPYGQQPQNPYGPQGQPAPGTAPYGQPQVQNVQGRPVSGAAPYGQQPQTHQGQLAGPSPYGLQSASQGSQTPAPATPAPYGQPPNYQSHVSPSAGTGNSPYGQQSQGYGQPASANAAPYGQQPTPQGIQPPAATTTPAPYGQPQSPPDNVPTGAPAGQRPQSFGQPTPTSPYGMPAPQGQPATAAAPYGQQSASFQTQSSPAGSAGPASPPPYGQQPSHFPVPSAPGLPQTHGVQTQPAQSGPAPYGREAYFPNRTSSGPYEQPQSAQAHPTPSSVHPFGQHAYDVPNLPTMANDPYSQPPQTPQGRPLPSPTNVPYGQQPATHQNGQPAHASPQSYSAQPYQAGSTAPHSASSPAPGPVSSASAALTSTSWGYSGPPPTETPEPGAQGYPSQQAVPSAGSPPGATSGYQVPQSAYGNAAATIPVASSPPAVSPAYQAPQQPTLSTAHTAIPAPSSPLPAAGPVVGVHVGVSGVGIPVVGTPLASDPVPQTHGSPQPSQIGSHPDPGPQSSHSPPGQAPTTPTSPKVQPPVTEISQPQPPMAADPPSATGIPAHVALQNDPQQFAASEPLNLANSPGQGGPGSPTRPQMVDHTTPSHFIAYSPPDFPTQPTVSPSQPPPVPAKIPEAVPALSSQTATNQQANETTQPKPEGSTLSTSVPLEQGPPPNQPSEPIPPQFTHAQRETGRQTPAPIEHEPQPFQVEHSQQSSPLAPKPLKQFRPYQITQPNLQQPSQQHPSVLQSFDLGPSQAAPLEEPPMEPLSQAQSVAQFVSNQQPPAPVESEFRTDRPIPQQLAQPPLQHPVPQVSQQSPLLQQVPPQPPLQYQDAQLSHQSPRMQQLPSQLPPQPLQHPPPQLSHQVTQTPLQQHAPPEQSQQLSPLPLQFSSQPSQQPLQQPVYASQSPAQPWDGPQQPTAHQQQPAFPTPSAQPVPSAQPASDSWSFSALTSQIQNLLGTDPRVDAPAPQQHQTPSQPTGAPRSQPSQPTARKRQTYVFPQISNNPYPVNGEVFITDYYLYPMLVASFSDPPKARSCWGNQVVNPLQTWFFHPSSPDFNICGFCHDTYISPSQFASDFVSKQEQGVRCRFHVLRITRLLWPRVVQSGDISPVVDFMKRRSSDMTCCGYTSNPNPKSAGIKWYMPRAGETDGRHAVCEACFEDTFVGGPFEARYAIAEQPADLGWCCDVWDAGGFAHRLALKGDWASYVDHLSRRGLMGACDGQFKMVQETRWWTVRGMEPNSNFHICELCYMDMFKDTRWEGVVEPFADQGVSSERCCDWSPSKNLNLSTAISAADRRKMGAEEFRRTIFAILSKPACGGREPLQDGRYYSLRASIPNFDICESCYESYVVPLGARQFFADTPTVVPGAGFCCFNRAVPQPQYFPRFIDAVQSGDWNLFLERARIAASLTSLPLPPCAGIDAKQGGRWWGWPDCTICEHCYYTFAMDTKFASEMPLQGMVGGAEESRICSLFSDGQRRRYMDVCAGKTSLEQFLGFCRERAAQWEVLWPAIQRLQVQVSNTYWRAQNLRILAHSARMGNAITFGSPGTTYNSTTTGRQYNSFSGVQAEQYDAEAAALERMPDPRAEQAGLLAKWGEWE